MDSILDAPPEFDVIVDQPENFVASEERDTTGHGTIVLDYLRRFAPEATYRLLRVIASDEEFRPSNFLKAMEVVETDDIDVVNVSAGKYHNGCGGDCRICTATARAAKGGAIVVVGAGNRTESKPLDVFCPARDRATVAVGMSETRCRASPPAPPDHLHGGATSNPPGAYWVEYGAQEVSDFRPEGPFCSYRRCSPVHHCDENRATVYWPGNVDWETNRPEIVAPGHVPHVDAEEGAVGIEAGTSYSAAVVSGGIATVLSEVFPNRPSPERVRRNVEASARELECGLVGKFDMERLLDALS